MHCRPLRHGGVRFVRSAVCGVAVVLPLRGFSSSPPPPPLLIVRPPLLPVCHTCSRRCRLCCRSTRRRPPRPAAASSLASASAVAVGQTYIDAQIRAAASSHNDSPNTPNIRGEERSRATPKRREQDVSKNTAEGSGQASRYQRPAKTATAMLRPRLQLQSTTKHARSRRFSLLTLPSFPLHSSRPLLSLRSAAAPCAAAPVALVPAPTVAAAAGSAE